MCFLKSLLHFCSYFVDEVVTKRHDVFSQVTTDLNKDLRNLERTEVKSTTIYVVTDTRLVSEEKPNNKTG